jgi:hypothetical protein
MIVNIPIHETYDIEDLDLKPDDPEANLRLTKPYLNE